MCWFVHSGARSCGVHRLLQTFGVRTTMIGTRCSMVVAELVDGREALLGELMRGESANHPNPLRRRGDGDLTLQHRHRSLSERTPSHRSSMLKLRPPRMDVQG